MRCASSLTPYCRGYRVIEPQPNASCAFSNEKVVARLRHGKKLDPQFHVCLPQPRRSRKGRSRRKGGREGGEGGDLAQHATWGPPEHPPHVARGSGPAILLHQSHDHARSFFTRCACPCCNRRLLLKGAQARVRGGGERRSKRLLSRSLLTCCYGSIDTGIFSSIARLGPSCGELCQP